MPQWSDDTYDPNDTQWARLDPTRGVPYDDIAADWAEQPTQPPPAIRPDDRYQRSASAPAPFWPQEQRPPARDPQAEAVAASDRRRLVWGGLAVGAILLAATLALLTQLGLPGSHTTVAPIQAGPHTTPLPTATTKPTATSRPTATPTPRPTATPIPSPTSMPSPTQAPSPAPAPSPTPLPPTPTPLPTPLPTATATVPPEPPAAAGTP